MVIARPGQVFALMFAINTVNYLDRILAAAVSGTLKHEFHLHDNAVGFLSSAFILVYTVAALPLGALADRFSRTRVIAFGVLLWSVASVATTFTHGFPLLFATRVGVGIGEASYLPAGTALLGAYFVAEQRARVMSRWQAGQIVGSALAFVLGAVFLAVFGRHLGWRIAFLFAGLPGFALALLILFVPDTPPKRVRTRPAVAPAPTATSGARRAKGGAPAAPKAAPPAAPQPAAATDHETLSFSRGALRLIGEALRIRTMWVVTILQACTFIIITPAATFLPIYLKDGRFHLNDSQAVAVAGAVTLLGGLTGVLLGGNVADWVSKRVPGGRVVTAALGFAIALPALALAFLTSWLPLFFLGGTLAILALYLTNGPLTAALQDATPPHLRATVVALSLLLGHLLGDIWASGAVGALSTRLGERVNLAMLIIGLPAMAIAIVVGFVGARVYAREAQSGG